MSVLGVFLDVSVRYRAVLVQVAAPILNQSMGIGCEMDRCAKFLDLGYGFENLEHDQPGSYENPTATYGHIGVFTKCGSACQTADSCSYDDDLELFW
jgi:hypothetical protein